MFYIDFIIFFLIGILFGFIFFILIILIISNYYSKKYNRDHLICSPLKKSIKFGTKATVQWINIIFEKIQNIFLKETFLIKQIQKILNSIVKEDSTIQSLKLFNLKFLNHSPKIISTYLKQSQNCESILFSFEFMPELIVEVDSIIKIPIINHELNLEINSIFHGLSGSLILTIPENKGPIILKFKKDLNILFDIGADLENLLNINSDTLGIIWLKITNWIHLKIQKTIITIFIEEHLFKNKLKTKNNNNFQMKLEIIKNSFH